MSCVRAVKRSFSRALSQNIDNKTFFTSFCGRWGAAGSKTAGARGSRHPILAKKVLGLVWAFCVYRTQNVTSWSRDITASRALVSNSARNRVTSCSRASSQHSCDLTISGAPMTLVVRQGSHGLAGYPIDRSIEVLNALLARSSCRMGTTSSENGLPAMSPAHLRAASSIPQMKQGNRHLSPVGSQGH